LKKKQLIYHFDTKYKKKSLGTNAPRDVLLNQFNHFAVIKFNQTISSILILLTAFKAII